MLNSVCTISSYRVKIQRI